MQKTENYGLNKPESTDKYNIEDINANMDIIDAELQKLFQRGDEVKQELVSRLIALGEEADTSKTFDELFAMLATVKRGSGTAQPEHVLAGQTFTNSDGIEYEGEMQNLAGTTLDANASTTDEDYVYVTPVEGYYDTTSKVRVAKDAIGGSGVTLLGTGTSFDLSGVVGYESFTTDNFLVVPTGGCSTSTNHHHSGEGEAHLFKAYGSYSMPTKSYNAETGILTVTQGVLGLSMERSYSTVEGKTVKGTHNVYLVVGDIETM